MVRDKQLCTSWEKKMEAKREKLLVKQYSLQLKEEKAREKEVSWMCVILLYVRPTARSSFINHLVFPGSVGKEEKERRKPEA